MPMHTAPHCASVRGTGKRANYRLCRDGEHLLSPEGGGLLEF